MFRESYGLKEAGLLTYSYPKDKTKLMMSKVLYTVLYSTVETEDIFSYKPEYVCEDCVVNKYE